MALPLTLDELNDDSVRLIANDTEKKTAYDLLRISTFNEYQKEEFLNELDSDVSLERLDDIMTNLRMNQGDPTNFRQKDINKILDRYG